jgi:NAD(P)-dependent dehydrogenase (short-subunit alcohol dehydrogenase family)
VKRFRGKVAIVTGGTMGIGEAIVRRLVAEGARVVIVARRAAPGDGVVAELGEAVELVLGDVAEPTTTTAAVTAAQRRGGLDVLVNNAAIDFTSDLLDTRIEDVERVFRTNLLGATSMLIGAARAMRATGGSIVNISSRLASIGVPTMTIYAASKGGLLALTRSAALDLAPLGIRVNAVAPGPTETSLMQEWLHGHEDPAAKRASVAGTIPQGRLATPRDVAAAVAFLAADEAGHITGANLAVDGGYTAA